MKQRWLVIAAVGLAFGCGAEDEEVVPGLATGTDVDTGGATGTAGTGSGTDADTTGTGTTGTGTTGGTGTDTGSPDTSSTDTSSTDTGSTDTGGTDPGTGGGGVLLTVTPAVVDFGATTIGKSKAGTFVIEHVGTQKVNVVSAKIDPPDAGFSYDDDEPLGLLVPTEKRSVDLTFVSGQVGSKTAQIELVTQPPLDPPILIGLEAIATISGSSITAEVVAGVPSLPFGPVAVGDEVHLILELENTSTDPITITAVSPGSGPFAAASAKPIPALVGSGTSVGITVSYKPAAAGIHTSELTVLTDSPITPQLTVGLSGTGFSGACQGQLECTKSVHFDGVTADRPSARALICRNEGLGPVNVTSIQTSLSAADGFETTTAALPAYLGHGEAVGVTILWSPTGAGQQASGSVVIKSDDCDGAQTIAVNADSASGPALAPCAQPGAFEAVTEWSWPADASLGPFAGVRMAPLVVALVDTDGDSDVDEQDVPAVVFVTHHNELAEVNDDAPGSLVAVRGDDGTPLWSTGTGGPQPSWAAQIAAAQLDGQGAPEIVAVRYSASPDGQKCPNVPAFLPAQFCGKYLTGALVAYHGDDGTVMWVSDPISGALTDLRHFGGPTVADLDGDGTPEVAWGGQVFDGASGRLEWVGRAGRGNEGHGFMAVAADVNGDGHLNLVAGNTAYRPNGEILWTATIGDTHASAAADLDGNGTVEVFVNASNGNAVLVAGKTGQVLAGPISAGVIGCCASAPTVAQLAGTVPGLEIALLGDDRLRVYDRELGLLWQRTVADKTGASGVVAFDLGGDGVAELFYADESTLWVLRGATGSPLMEVPRNSGTALDLPVVADVDGDGHAEVLLTGESGIGLSLLADSGSQWAGARRAWTQHGFSPGLTFDNAVPAPHQVEPLGALTLRATPALCP